MEDKKEGHLHHHGHAHKHHEHHSSLHHHAPRKNNLENIILIAALALVLLLVVNIFLAFGANKKLKEGIEAAKEAAKPAKIQLTLIKNSKCADCFDASPFAAYVKSSKVELLNEETLELGSSEAKGLISKYNIQKIPSVLVTGELEKLNLEGFNKVQDALVLSQISPPYTDAASGKIVGRVRLKLIKDESCSKCSDMELLLAQLRFAGINLAEQKNISINSDEGRALAAKYKIDFVPTVILSEDAGEYAIIQQAWPQIGTKEKDAYVLRTVYPPFMNLTMDRLRGLVNVVYLVDKSCTECYNASFHKSVLTSPQSFAMTFNKEETVDIEDAKGKELIAKYNITQAPTVILSDEASAYPSSEGLKQFFSLEKNGYYVFRQAQVIGAYKDLTTNSVVKPQENQGQQA